ncbi:L-glutamine--2-deoxy-scyllo-inosose aminotransferase KanB [Winogradskyella sp. PC-19]|uniref:DegT/DnrJ/EryC1/StrS family aminotransferase n=1 Tax=unclassified Winogradskyella TaxID=2615021 RepID=UPI000B3D2F8B|nr:MULTISPECIES: DegT/DnrJ/EryC1/StrS family aminotransferase [unclassified Winogradskyella]ARV08384.1 L-glutamine--2-deoxy-scyllo-inosose aminotransferase KanB [Winogradskyella sp. PC-19]
MPGFELFGDAERDSVKDVLDNGVLMRYGFDGMRNGHWKARDLESELQKTFNTNHVQLVSSGTAAVSVALASAGIGAGDEVIMPTFTFVASFEAIMMLGAIPVLVDIDSTLTLDPESVEAAITPNTKAVMIVQMCGSMGDMNTLKSICDRHNLIFVEDACQAIGGSYDGKPLGSIADVGCFSFDFVKTITCGEGGAVITNNKDYYLNADHYSDHGHDHIGNDRGAETHTFLGYNFRISELHAAVGLAQVKRLPEFLAIQKKHFDIIRNELATIPEVEFRAVPEGGVESCAFLNFFLPDLETSRKVSAAFKESGVDVCWNYYDNNWHYVREWHHLKEAKSLYPLSPEMKSALNELKSKNFSQSDHFIGRNISCLIKLSWTEDEVKQRAIKMRNCILEALQE